MTLREHRQSKLNETLQTVAERAGVSYSLLSLIERGAPFGYRHRDKIARGYKLTVKQLERLWGTAK